MPGCWIAGDCARPGCSYAAAGVCEGLTPACALPGGYADNRPAPTPRFVGDREDLIHQNTSAPRIANTTDHTR
ncbi:hypothetical protein ATM97_19250 [Nocardia sp. MH4]|nr:hypothetical protein [Nocardia sp. MH4]